MVLNIVIVNYNVKYFLKQCLASVLGSQLEGLHGSTPLELDVWMVDNDSVDGSVEMVRRDFPSVHVIENHENVGFARANNQALREIEKIKKEENNSHLILLLNPDTIVERDTFVKCANFMQEHPDCGGLCVKMVDGEGNYLKESKRGFPTPEASFYKISGLIKLFPRSRRIGAYYMGHLPEDEVNEVEIMPGAFLMFRSEVYDKIGGLDESYFMYGEDIDFSWRIHMAGWKNYYFPATHIIHYKGESTKKGSMNYVYTFYNAMSIFVKRYFSGGNAKLFNALLHLAIWMRATAAWVGRILRQLAVPALDFAVAYGGFVLLKHLWASLWANNIDYYPREYTFVVIPVYILILMAGSWLQGGYDKPVRPGRIVKGMGIGLLLLLAFYSLLDEGQRYSRMLLLAGSLWTIGGTLLTRVLLSAAHVKGYALRARRCKTILVVGSDEETRRVKDLYQTLSMDPVPHNSSLITHPPSLNTHHLQDLIRIEHVEEVIFCGADIELPHIIGLMASLKTTGVEYKIAPAEGDYIIGSNSILSHDSLYLDDLNTISTDSCRRNKRLFDLATALFLLTLSPLLFWFQQRKKSYFKHCLSVLAGGYSWVGYTGRKGIFSPADLIPGASPEVRDRLMLRYMRRYRTITDLSILTRNWRRIGGLILLILALHHSPCSAQRIHGMVMAGGTLSQIEGDELKGFRLLGFTGGVGAIAALDQKEIWHLSVEATYTQRGAYNNSGDPYNMALALKYIDIPLMVHFRDPWGGMLLGAGLTYGRLVEQPHGSMLLDTSYFVPDTAHMSFLSNDLLATLDIRFPVWKNLYFNIRWQYSILAIKRDWQFTEYTGGYDAEGHRLSKTWTNRAYNHSLTFRLIWRF